MLLLDSLARFSACGICLALMALLLRDVRGSIQGKLALCLCVCVMASLLWQSPQPLPHNLGLLALLLVTNLNMAFWWFCRSLFDDNFRLRWIDWALLALWFISGLPQLWAYQYGAGGWVTYADGIRSAGGGLIVLHIAWLAWHGRFQDLIEPRRKIRLPFALCANFWLLFIIGSEVSQVGETLLAWLNVIEALGLMLLLLWGLLWMAAIPKDALLFTVRGALINVTQAKFAQQQQQLLQLMQAQKPYLSQGLTVAELAQQLKLPQHQLRQLINQTLGFRNFSAFLNQYRVNAAKQLLRDPAQQQVSILVIAMDVGYASLAPFNRAFQAQEQCTPRQFRKQQPALPVSDSE